ncbi:MAG TPA: FGGY family carbohydrate kinase [Lactovum miscens]|uniref:gluconokinase n=1 Tax=Lactovum miscens TaxID=190387 RepID=UPI002ED84D12
MKYFIGLDIGTTATKAVLFDEKKVQVCKSEKGYKLYRDVTGKAEEDPEEIFLAVIETISKLTKILNQNDELLAVSFSSQMHSLIAMNKNWEKLTNLITWADTRSDKFAQKLKAQPDAQGIYERTGTPIHPMTPLSKILWLRGEKNEIFEKTAHFLDIKGYIFWRLFAVNKIDLSVASGTGLLNNQILEWDSELLSLLGISKDLLPVIVSPYEYEVSIEQGFAEEMGVPKQTGFIWGAGDGPLANLGVSAIDTGQVALTIGTSGAIRSVTERPQVDSKRRTFSYALDAEHWVTGGPVTSGGDVFRWLQEEIFEKKYSFDDLTALASTVPAGSNGLIFHPYLGGERAPLWDADARADFYGLNYSHKPAHLARAILEGIVFNLSEVAEGLGEINEIFATGGFTQSELWLQILSDIFDKPIKISQSSEAGCLAAVIMAEKALGLTSKLESPENVVRILQPIQKNVIIYQELSLIYHSLTVQLQPLFRKISNFQKKYSN